MEQSVDNTSSNATWFCKGCASIMALNATNFTPAGKGFRKTCIPCSKARRDAALKKRQRAVSKAAAAEEDEAKDALHTKWDDSQQSPEKKRQRLEDARQARQARLSRNTVLPNAANAPDLPAPLPLPTHSPNPTPRMPEPNVGDELQLEPEPEPEPELYLDPINWQMIENFHNALDTHKMEVCSRCKERWFEMRLEESVCRACRARDSSRKMKEGMPFLMTDLNNMDPGEMPDLPKLTQMEEMCIAQAHVHMQVKRV
jgi:hypothetical protein